MAHKILLIEDEAGIASFIQQGLEEEGYTIQWATDGSSGLKLALNHHFDLILLDWMLPKMSGLQICKEIRNQKITTPIIFITAKDLVSETIEALESGANDYIKKPFHFDELLARIQVQLREYEVEEKYTWGNISLHKNTREVFLNDNPIHLTQKEFDLLHYLLVNKNTICHRKDIIRNVWEINFEYDTSVIDVYINALRKKLNLNKNDSALQTVRGIGFILKDYDL